MERERSMVWCAAMLPHLKKPISHEAFVRPSRKAARQSPEEQQRALEFLARAWGASLE